MIRCECHRSFPSGWYAYRLIRWIGSPSRTPLTNTVPLGPIAMSAAPMGTWILRDGAPGWPLVHPSNREWDWSTTHTSPCGPTSNDVGSSQIPSGGQWNPTSSGPSPGFARATIASGGRKWPNACLPRSIVWNESRIQLRNAPVAGTRRIVSVPESWTTT